MADFKLTIANPKDGKCVQRELKAPNSQSLVGKKIGDKIDGSTINLEGYEFVLTGGSDYCGFPMRKDVAGSTRKRILAIKGTGLKKKARGIKQRKTVCGNTVSENTVQINLKIVKTGKEALFTAKKEESGKEEAKVDEKPAKKEEKEEAKPKTEEKAETKEDKKESNKEDKDNSDKKSEKSKKEPDKSEDKKPSDKESEAKEQKKE